MNILSLFDGISCGQVALERAGIKIDNYYAYEIDKYAIQVTQKNYPNTIQCGDVKNADFTHFKGKIDIIIAGSPCQGFSYAGKRLNFDDPRSKLYFEFVRALKEVQPKYFLLENVKMKDEWKHVIDKGLRVKAIEINSSLVSAQNRKRLYWTNIPDVIQPEDKGILLKDIVHENFCEIIFDSFNINPSGKGINGEVTPLTKNKCGTLTTNKGEGKKISIPLNEYIVPFDKTLQILDKEVEKGKVGYFRKDSQANRVYYIHDKAVTLCGAAGGGAAKMGQYLFGNINKSKDNLICGNLKQKVKVRKNEVDKIALQKVLREHKNITNKEISKKLKIKLTTVEHWFRTDNSFSIPDAEIWLKLKEILNITTKQFDSCITEFIVKDNEYEMSNRVYFTEGKGATLTTTPYKIFDYLFGCITPDRINKRQNGQRFSEGKKFYTLTAQDKHGILVEGYIRKLTPVECERLQTLPDNYTAGISNGQRYKCLGNGWTVDVITHILKNIKT